MLKDTDKYETNTHFSYREYDNKKKKKVKKSPNSDVTVFVSVFIIGVLLVLGFAKILSPNVDVAINDDEEQITEIDDDTENSVVDERLRHLQLEDAGKKAADSEMFSPELDEKVVLPKERKKTVGEMAAAMSDYMQSQKYEQQVNDQYKEAQKKTEPTAKTEQNVQPKKQAPAPTPTAKETPKVQQAPQPAQIVNAKVVVGYYATEKQAEVAKSIIQDAGLSVTPIVKNIGTYYTLQVGAYTSKEKAQQAANNLLKSNFPARVLVD